MPSDQDKASRLLRLTQAAVRDLGTNPYQMAKATGLPLSTVQRLLSAGAIRSITNVETLLDALGLEVQLVRKSRPQVKPGTGRGHGVRIERRPRGS